MNSLILHRRLTVLDSRIYSSSYGNYISIRVLSSTKEKRKAFSRVGSNQALDGKYLIPFIKEHKLMNRRKIRWLQIRWSPDIFYQSRWLSRLMNKFIKSGKKSIAEKMLLSLLVKINQTSNGNSILLFHEALERIKPVLTIVVRRVGRRFYEVPVPLDPVKQYKLALRWLTEVSRKNQVYPIADTLADEILTTVFTNRSETLKKKEDLYDNIIRNRAYTHYRWI